MDGIKQFNAKKTTKQYSRPFELPCDRMCSRGRLTFEYPEPVPEEVNFSREEALETLNPEERS